MHAVFKNLAKILFIFLPTFLHAQERTVPTNKSEALLSYSSIVKEVGPAVVNIYAVKLIKGHASPLLQDPNFRHLFGIDERTAHFRLTTKMQRSLGSGVIVRADGLVVTSYHVIQNAAQIKVVLADGREFDAIPKVHEKDTDLAILQLQQSPKDLPFVKLRTLDTLEVGDVVLAIGNPFGLEQTITQGIISSFAHGKTGHSDWRGFIQTDAAINPGNSGGALVTTDGKLVGISTFIFSKTGGSMGIGFAIPADLIAPLVASAERGGTVARPWDGLTVRNAPQGGGVVVTDIYPGSPASKSAIKIGDTITAINDKPVTNQANYKYRLAIGKVNENNVYTVLKSDKTAAKYDIKLETPPGSKEGKIHLITGRNPLSGAGVADLTPALAIRLNLDLKARGVLVVDVVPNSNASHVGLLPGDIIESVNHHKVHSIREAVTNLSRARGGWHITIRRGNEELLIAD